MKAPKANAKLPLAAQCQVHCPLHFSEESEEQEKKLHIIYKAQQVRGSKSTPSTFPHPAGHQWYTNMLAVPIHQLQCIINCSTTKHSRRYWPHQDTITNSTRKYRDGRSHSRTWSKKSSPPPSRNSNYLHPNILPFQQMSGRLMTPIRTGSVIWRLPWVI